MRSIGVLLVRLTVGGLLVGHGAQKLFGWFGGAGLRGTSGWLESLRMRPAMLWARLAGVAELGGGLLTALGLLNPLGPIAAMGAMVMAWAKVHLDKPIWVTKGGAELPLTNLAVLSAIALAGPGRLSIDGLLGIRVPRRLGLLALGGVAASVWYGARPEMDRAASAVVGSLEALGALAVEEATGPATEPDATWPATEPDATWPATEPDATWPATEPVVDADPVDPQPVLVDEPIEAGNPARQL